MVTANKLKPTLYIGAVPELRLRAGRVLRPKLSVWDGRVTRRRRRPRSRHPGGSMWMLRRRLGLMAGLTGFLALVTACGGNKVLAPPRLDLTEMYRVGLVGFTIENAKGSLNELATGRFAQAILDGQPGVEVLELGAPERVLDEIGERELGARAARAIGNEYGIPAVFLGHMKVSDVKPRGVLAGFQLPRVEASVNVEMTVRMLSTESGATMWSKTGRATETVGEIGLLDGEPFFAAENPDNAYGRLVEILIYEVTHDLRPQWVRGD